MERGARAGVVMLAVWAGSAAASFREETLRVPWGLCARGDSTAVCTLEATLFVPSGPGPFPLVVLSHGASGGPDPAPRWRPLEHAEWFTSRGWALVVPMRRGNAGSEGAWAEGFGRCDGADFVRPSFAAAEDLRATIDAVGARADIDRRRVVLIGHSAGGFASLAAAQLDIPGVVEVLTFAGGRGSLTDDGGRTRTNCSPSALVTATRAFGRKSRTPTVWLYAENDAYFPPELARRMFDAFVEAGGRGRFVQLPPFGREGHHVGWKAAGIAVWAPIVEAALAEARAP